jgi:hypothetical protein
MRDRNRRHRGERHHIDRDHVRLAVPRQHGHVVAAGRHPVKAGLPTLLIVHQDVMLGHIDEARRLVDRIRGPFPFLLDGIAGELLLFRV